MLADDGHPLPEELASSTASIVLVLEEGSDAEATLRAAHRDVFDAELESFTTPGYLDGRVFVQYAGIPTLVYGPISEAIHGNDERVELESVRRMTKAIALFAAEWCGVAD